MGPVLYLVAVLAAGTSLKAEASGSLPGPTYSAASIVNAASNVVGALAPNTFATIYGENLSYEPAWAPANVLRTELAGVRVTVGAVSAVLYYVSPGQINLLIPSSRMLGGPEAELYVAVDSKTGPTVKIPLREAAPALFQWSAETVVATRADWTKIDESAPARPGEIVVLWATGLGETIPEVLWGQVPQAAAQLRRLSDFRVLLDGEPVEAKRILYAGVAPGFAGLYQINLRLPEKLESNPEIRIELGSQVSPAGLRLPVRAGAGQADPAQPGPAAARY